MTSAGRFASTLADAADAADQHGRSLAELSTEAPLLVVFLRHSGCTFCRQVLSDLARERSAIEAAGLRIALVHMSDDADGQRLFRRFDLDDVSRFSDPDRRLYQAFALQRGRAGRMLSPRVWWRGFLCCIVRRHGLGWFRGDVRQLPGAFVVHRRRIVHTHRADSPDDRPDFCRMIDVAPSVPPLEKMP
jgi:peroxiredoxin